MLPDPAPRLGMKHWSFVSLACLSDEGADAVDRRRDLLRPRQAQLPRVSPEVPQRVQAVVLYGIQRPLHHLFDPAAPLPGGELADDAGYSLRLAGLGELLQVRQVHAFPAELDCLQPLAPRRLPLATPKVYGGCSYPPASRRMHHSRAGRYPGRELLADL